MTFSRYLWLVILAGVATAMAIAIVVMSAFNERTQRDLQARQAALSSGVLGPQGHPAGYGRFRHDQPPDARVAEKVRLRHSARRGDSGGAQ